MIFDKVDDATAFRVLLAAYQFIEKPPSPEKVAAFLKNEGSKISLEIVRRILQRYGVEKKLRIPAHRIPKRLALKGRQ